MAASYSYDSVDSATEPSSDSPLVTVVVPARNEQDSIKACIDSILDQDYPKLEILVVDGDSDDATASIVESYARSDERIKLIPNPDRIIPRALNLALAQASGRYLVRVDAHSTIPPSYVTTAVDLLSTGDWAGVGGRKDGVGRTAAGRAIALVMASPFGVGGSTYHYGEAPGDVEHIPFGSYVVDKARRLGGWDERLRVNQDFEFDYRMRLSGERLHFDPRLSINWECRQSVRDLWRQYVRYGGGKAKVLALHPASASPRHVAVPGFVAALGVSVFVAPWTRIPMVALLVPYVSFVGLGVTRIAKRTDDRRVRLWIAPSLLAMHLGWGIGFLKGVPAAIKTLLVSRKQGMSDSEDGARQMVSDARPEERAM